MWYLSSEHEAKPRTLRHLTRHIPTPQCNLAQRPRQAGSWSATRYSLLPAGHTAAWPAVWAQGPGPHRRTWPWCRHARGREMGAFGRHPWGNHLCNHYFQAIRIIESTDKQASRNTGKYFSFLTSKTALEHTAITHWRCNYPHSWNLGFQSLHQNPVQDKLYA